MANYDNLPVFKASYDLLLDVFRIAKNWSRDLRYSLGEDLKREIIHIQQLVYQANSSTDKLPYIGEARLAIVKIKLLIRLTHDLRETSLKQYALLSEKAESISKQLAAWEKSQENRKST